MLSQIEEILFINNIKYTKKENSLSFKPGPLCSKVRIEHLESQELYRLISGETNLAVSSMLSFIGATLMLASSFTMISIISAGLLISSGVFSLFTILLTHTTLLDLRAQCRSQGIYLVNGAYRHSR